MQRGGREGGFEDGRAEVEGGEPEEVEICGCWEGRVGGVGLLVRMRDLECGKGLGRLLLMLVNRSRISVARVCGGVGDVPRSRLWSSKIEGVALGLV